MFRIPLKYRITAVIFSLAAILLAAVLSQSLSQYFQGSRDQFVQQKQTTLKLLSGFARTALLTTDYETFQPHLEQVSNLPGVAMIELADERGIVIAASNPVRVGKSVSQPDAAQANNWQLLPIENEAGRLGSLVARFSDNKLKTLHRLVRKQAIGWSLTGLGLIAIAAFLAGHLLTRRLEKVTRAAALVASGDLSTQAEVNGRDEVAELGQVFDSMVRKIKDDRNRLEEREQFLAMTLDSIGDAVITTNEKGHVSRMNPVAEQLTGWSFEDAQGLALKTIFPIVNASTRKPMDNPIEKVMATGKIVYLSNHTTLIAKDGSEYQIADSAAPIRNGDNNIQGMVLVFNDVTEQYQLREVAAKSKRDLQAIMDHSPAVIFLKDTEGRYLFINRQFETLFHIKRKDIVGKTDHDVFPEKQASEFQQHDKDVLTAEHALEFEETVSHDDDLHSYISVKFPLFNESGNAYGVCGISTDITERKVQEEQLRRSQKMDALGKLTGGIAHDYNNLLGIIMGYAEQLNESLSHETKLAKYAHDIQHAAERGARLTQKLLAFSQHKTPDSRVLNINTLLQEQQLMLEKILTVRIKLSFDLEQDLWPVELDMGDLEDAIVNMSINAMHAMKEGGEFTLRTRNEQLNTLDAGRLNLDAGDYVLLSVTDSGCGMNKATKEKIFDPFFSTKGERGTGLGLSQVYGFVARSNGAIKIYSEPGHGSRFALYFPKSQQSIAEITAPAVDTSLKLQGNETILVVDDEQALMELAHSILTNKGYRVLTANNGKQALAILEKENASVDILMSDVIMPNMDGYQLAAQVQQRYPHIKILMTSGFADDRHNNMSDNAIHRNILYKPYTSNRLLTHVRKLLNEGETQTGSTDNLSGRTILVMDDEKDVRDLYILNLERLGCKTIPACNGDEAISFYQQSMHNGKPIDAVIMDLTILGGMGGKEVADKIRILDPNARMIVASGHTYGPEMTQYRDYGFNGALEKSFNREKIKQVLAQVLSTSQQNNSAPPYKNTD